MEKDFWVVDERGLIKSLGRNEFKNSHHIVQIVSIRLRFSREQLLGEKLKNFLKAWEYFGSCAFGFVPL